MHSKFARHVSARHCHHLGVVVTSEATKAISVLWMYMDYDSSIVVSCRGMQPRVVILQYNKTLGPTIKKISLKFNIFVLLHRHI
jgi:hypothetical protein